MKELIPATLVEQAVLSNIATRSSIRRYTSQSIEAEKVEKMLRAAMAAPSAVNLQPWSFLVIENRAILDELARGLPYATMLKGAPIGIVICGDTLKSKYWVEDCAAATQNLLLAAHAMGLGAVWCATYPYQDRIQVIERHAPLCEGCVPLCIVAVGYPAGESKSKDKWKPEKIRYIK